MTNFIKIINFVIIIIMLAIAAAFLSSSKNKEKRNLQIGYLPEKELTTTFDQNQNFDFFNFGIDPIGKIKRQKRISPQQDGKTVLELEEEKIIKSYISNNDLENFTVMVNNDDNSDVLEELSESKKQDKVASYNAIKNSDVESCDLISDARIKKNCKGEISFQMAIAKNNQNFCEEIESESLKLRCLSYFN
jgi:prolyl-tRNA synthetase